MLKLPRGAARYGGIALALLFAACSASTGSNGFVTGQASSSHAASAKKPHGYLYVANYAANTITVYAPGASSVLRTISSGIQSPYRIIFDTAGNLYVANNSTQFGSSIVVYAPGSATVARKITAGIHSPGSLAFDASGNLYVANFSGGPGSKGSISVYARGKNTVLRTIASGISHPKDIGFDPKGNLYVANSGLPGSVTVYAPGASTVLRSITDKIDNPFTLIFDVKGNLYVGNAGVIGSTIPHGSISTYALGQTTAKYSTTIGVYQPEEFAFDNNRNLYVTDTGYQSEAGTITAYSTPQLRRLRTLVDGLDQPDAIACDTGGNMVSGNAAGAPSGYLLFFAPYEISPLRSVSAGIDVPIDLKFNAHG